MSPNYERRGFFGAILIALMVAGLAGIYFGYHWYQERFYLRFYDGEMVRYMDLPPYSDRLSPARDELRGYCQIRIGTTHEQANQFLHNVCDRYGYVFSASQEAGRGGFLIQVRRDYPIEGRYSADNLLTLTWQPVLTGSNKAKAEKLSGAHQTDKKEE